jgi:choline-glycine betaine transporter
MRVRLFFMAAGSLLCIALVFLSRGALAQAPKLLGAQVNTLTAAIGWAYVLATVLVPVVCIVSLLRGWLAWSQGQHEKAPSRLLVWPLAAVAIAMALFGLGRIIP